MLSGSEQSCAFKCFMFKKISDGFSWNAFFRARKGGRRKSTEKLLQYFMLEMRVSWTRVGAVEW